ncbi:MAG: acyl-CoA dehydrogenase family protein, partial [Pseudomonas sp.]
MRKLVLNTFKKFLPPLSRTEKEALESGTVGWDGELIGGHPNWDKLFELKKPEFTAEEQAFLDGPVQKLCDMIDNWQVAHDKDLPPEVWQFMKDNGFFGLEVPTEHGGLGFSSQLHSAVVMKVSSRNIAAGVTVGVPNSLGPAELIHKYGTDEQKHHYLPRLAKGVDVPCFALTEPGAGSDAGSIEARGTLFMDGNKLSVRLNFEKRYITLAPISTLAGLAFKLEDPDNLLGR